MESLKQWFFNGAGVRGSCQPIIQKYERKIFWDIKTETLSPTDLLCKECWRKFIEKSSNISSDLHEKWRVWEMVNLWVKIF